MKLSLYRLRREGILCCVSALVIVYHIMYGTPQMVPPPDNVHQHFTTAATKSGSLQQNQPTLNSFTMRNTRAPPVVVPSLQTDKEKSVKTRPVHTFPVSSNPYYTGDIDGGTDGGATKSAALLNAVIVFLHGGRWHSYFVRECLPRLERYFLKCFPYPIRIFHEDSTKQHKDSIRAIVPSAAAVTFERVDFSKLPGYTTEAELARWMKEGLQYKFQGRGYRMMCRFWGGYVWRLPSMAQYDYYLRLDTDSVFDAPVRVDLFRHLTRQGCVYGYNRLKGENPHVIVELWPTFRRWASKELAPSALAAVEALAHNKKVGFWGPMYYNNFEMGTMWLKTHPVYQSGFLYLDENSPYGFLRYRWGDAPVHTLLVWAVLATENMLTTGLCNFTRSVAPYRHAAFKLPPMPAGVECTPEL
eukprot:PhM_4_TR3183/c0_g1_i1/m.58974/K10967/KTR1_3; alpha 1,2-mannosyltransferase